VREEDTREPVRESAPSARETMRQDWIPVSRTEEELRHDASGRKRGDSGLKGRKEAHRERSEWIH